MCPSLLRRARDFAQVEGNGIIDIDIVQLALNRLGIDALGLDGMDRRILDAIADKFDGGPVGIDNLSTAIGEEANTIEDVYDHTSSCVTSFSAHEPEES